MKSLLWILAFLLTVSAAVYQRLTGPTYPIKEVVNTGIQKYPVLLMRSHSGKTDCKLVFVIPDITVKGVLNYRKFPTRDEMIKVDFKREGEKLVGILPNQPPAGKLEYKVELSRNEIPLKIGSGSPVVIRFTGEVPKIVLGVHIFLMFLAMLLSNITALFSLFNFRSYKILAIFTLVVLLAGGMVLGPIVQKYAFNELWTGAPFGWDLTDNKTLIAILAWVLAIVMIRKKNSRLWVIAASLITIIIFSIPHSLWGSQLNQETGKIIQGHIFPFLATYLY